MAERLDITFAALGAIKGTLDRGIRPMDERKDHFTNVADRSHHPFGANHVVLPVSDSAAQEAERSITDLDDRLKALSDKHPEEGGSKFAILCTLFPFERTGEYLLSRKRCRNPIMAGMG